MYTYYHGIIDHSGITFKHYWWQPWQPDCIFHDNHHQYFHVNFGFNIKFWDQVSSVSFPRLVRLEVFRNQQIFIVKRYVIYKGVIAIASSAFACIRMMGGRVLLE